MKRFVKYATASLLGIAMVAGVGISVDRSINERFNAAQAAYTPPKTYEVSDTPAELNSYYSTITDSLSGNSLLSALQDLNSDKRKTTVGYNTMGTNTSGAYVYTDYDLDNTAIDAKGQIYGTKVASFYTKTAATSWNREHVWPNSHGGDTVDNDILHTRPTISSENSSRGNSFYVEGMNHSANGWDPYTAGYDRACRGECARIILYSVVANPNLNLSELTIISNGQTGYSNTMGQMSTLIRWHFEYSPNVYEMNRNNGAEYLQGNRNPFVDHPEYVARIWSNFNSTVTSLCDEKASMYDDWTPGTYSTYGTNDAAGEITPGKGVTISSSSETLLVDESTSITATSSDNSTITWSTSASSVVTINKTSAASGTAVTITGKAVGSATITAKATIDGNQYSKTCDVSVVEAGGQVGGYTLVTANSMLANNDKVVVKTSADLGVTGWNNNKDATVSSTESNWKQFTVKDKSSSGFKLYDDAASQYIASPGGNEFKYSTSGGVCSPDSSGHLQCNSRFLCVNGTNYRFYTTMSGYTPFFIYKVSTASSGALTFAQTFLTKLTCNAAGTSAPTYATGYSWNQLSSEFSALSADDKNTLKTATANESGNAIERAMARYDFIVRKYGYTNFIGRTIASGSNFMSLVNNNPTLTIVLIAGFASVLATAAFLTIYYRKRKQQ